MKNLFIKSLSSALFVAVIGLTSCKQDAPVVPPTPVNYSFSESFDSLSVAYAKGWTPINRSLPLGTTSWLNNAIVSRSVTSGKTTTTTTSFLSTAGSNFSGTDAIYTAYTCAVGTDAVANNWLLTPSVNMKNGDKISFFTRCPYSPAVYPDRLQVRINPVDDNTNIPQGTTTAVGDYTNLLLDINPTFALSGATAFPAVWTKYTVTLSGLTGLAKHRIAFRYMVDNVTTKGFGVGIDEVVFTSAQ